MNIFASSAGRLLTHCRIRIILNTGETPSGGFVCLGLSDFDLASAARALEFSVPRLDLNSVCRRRGREAKAPRRYSYRSAQTSDGPKTGRDWPVMSATRRSGSKT